MNLLKPWTPERYRAERAIAVTEWKAVLWVFGVVGALAVVDLFSYLFRVFTR